MTDTTSAMREALEKILAERWTYSPADLKRICEAALTAPAQADIHAPDPGRTLGGISTPMMQGDNLAVLLCSHFDNLDQPEDENGWTPDAIAGCDEVLAAIRAHYGKAHSPTPPRVDELAAPDGGQIDQEAIENFHRDFGDDLIHRAQQLVDGLGEPRLGFETISVDTINAAMMLAGVAVVHTMGRGPVPSPRVDEKEMREMLATQAEADGEFKWAHEIRTNKWLHTKVMATIFRFGRALTERK